VHSDTCVVSICREEVTAERSRVAIHPWEAKPHAIDAMCERDHGQRANL
jgi:hypothetical protein